MCRTFIVLLLLFPVLALAQVYKWTDATGKVQYSDRPVSGAETLDVPLRKAQSIPTRADAPSTPGSPSPGPYQQFAILSPESGATVRDAEGQVQIGLLLEPALMEGHRLEVVLDGAPLGGDAPGTQLAIKGLAFGSHQLQAQIRDAAGTLVAASPIIRFSLLKPESSP